MKAEIVGICISHNKSALIKAIKNSSLITISLFLSIDCKLKLAFIKLFLLFSIPKTKSSI